MSRINIIYSKRERLIGGSPSLFSRDGAGCSTGDPFVLLFGDAERSDAEPGLLS